MTRIASLGLLLAAALMGCPPGPAPMPPDASDASRVGDTVVLPLTPAVPPTPTCIAACNTMKALGCADGKALSCPSTMTKVDADKELRMANGQPVTCAGCASAKTAADVAALCGSSCSP